MRIETDRRGSYHRVTVQHLLVEKAPVLALQHKLAQTISGFKPQPKNDLHLTLFHFGRPHELYKQFKQQNPELKAHNFWEHFWQLLSRTEQVVKRHFELRPNGLRLFGNPDSPVIAIEMEIPAWLRKEREAVEAAWQQFLTGCGVSSMKAERPYRPHLSLGRIQQPVELPDLPLPDALDFGTSHLRNVKPSQ